jgi:predicted DNA binding CopG/RHH family protein
MLPAGGMYNGVYTIPGTECLSMNGMTTMSNMIPVEHVEDIPTFANEDEEDQFWSTHRFGDALLAQMEPVSLEGDDVLPPARPRSTPVQIRFPDDLIRRAKLLAASRNTGYQTMIKEFVAERLYEEEKRAGMR